MVSPILSTNLYRKKVEGCFLSDGGGKMVAKRLGETVVFSEQGEFKQMLAWDCSLSDSLSLAFFQQQKEALYNLKTS